MTVFVRTIFLVQTDGQTLDTERTPDTDTGDWTWDMTIIMTTLDCCQT